jgi:glutaredoxin-like protein NrdH
MEQHKVVLYGRPGCGPCVAVKASLNKAGIAYEYEYVDVTTSQEALEHVKALGHQHTPVIETEDDHWTDFRPDKVAALAQVVAQ